MRLSGRYRKQWVTVYLLIFLVLAAGCQRVDVGPLQTEDETVELGGAGAVEAEINMGFGELTIGGGAADLLEASFTYNVAKWKPEVSYAASGDTGRLEVSHPEALEGFQGANPSGIRYEWDLRFNDDVPMALQLNMGAGQSEIDLSGTRATELNIDAGAGQMHLNLGGSALQDLGLSLGAGEVTIDLTGDWANDLAGEIEGGVGTLTIRLPAAVGVRVEVSGGLGSVTANGLQKDGDVYTNDAYESAATVIELDVEGGVGEIRLEVVG